MSKTNHELASWKCLYENNARTIKELEDHYKIHPHKNIKEEIIARLGYQKDLLKKINSCGFSKYYFDTIKVNKKYAEESKELKKINEQASKVVNSKKSSKAAYRVATSLLIASLLTGLTSSTAGKCIGEAEITPELVDELAEKDLLTKETIKAEMTMITGEQPQITVHTLECKNKYYDINCPEELQDYFYELEQKWKNIPASLAMLLVDQESDGHWNTNGVISPTNDYGLSQINKCNHARIYKDLGYTDDDLKNDPYKNLDAMFYILDRVFDLYDYSKDDFDMENVCGTYNGYIKWKNKQQSVDYVNECIERYNEKFAEDQESERLLVPTKY